MRCKNCSKTFRSPPPRMRESQICTECQGTYVPDKNSNANPKNSTKFYSNTVDMGNVAAEDIDISKGQAEFLKSIMKHVRIGEFGPTKLRQIINRNIDTKYFINENWGDEEHFISLALDEKNSNQISQILYFLNVKNKIERVPTKQDMKELSVIDISEYEKKFRAWENFLDLLGFDPWYKNNNSTVPVKKIKSDSEINHLQEALNESSGYLEKGKKKFTYGPGPDYLNNKRVLTDQEHDNLFYEDTQPELDTERKRASPKALAARRAREKSWELVSKDDTLEDTIKKINELRTTIKENFKKKDLEENYADYSYVEMFDLLEKYIEIMPNKSKYNNIKDLLKF